MITDILGIVIGFLLLVKGADWFVDGSSAIATKSSVVLLIADTTTTILLPFIYSFTTDCAAFLILEPSPTEVPPNFATIKSINMKLEEMERENFVRMKMIRSTIEKNEAEALAKAQLKAAQSE